MKKHLVLSGIFLLTLVLRVSGNTPPLSAGDTLILDFDTITDFSLVLKPWTNLDVGGGPTKEIAYYTFPHSGEPMGYICFNPNTTTPPLQNLQPHSGTKMGCCFSSVVPFNPNNKWLISPRITPGYGSVIDLWVRTMNSFYGYERYNIAVCTGDINPSNFVNLTSSPEAAPEVWTYKYYDLSGYANQAVYVGIQCVTDNGFVFMVDDIRITKANGIADPAGLPGAVVYPNPARDRVFIRVSGTNDQLLNAQMVDVAGNPVKNVNFRSQSGTYEMDIRGFAPGLYSLILTGDTQRKVLKLMIN